MKVPNWLANPSSNTHSADVLKKYWLRTAMGMESQVAEEVKAKLEIVNSYTSHRSLFVQFNQSPISPEVFKTIHTADDVFLYLGAISGITRVRASLEQISIGFRARILPHLQQEQPNRFIRVTVSFVGKRNYSRFEVEEVLNQVITQHTSLKTLSNKNQDPKVPNELRLRLHIEDEISHFGLALFSTPLHRRSWRDIRYNGQLHPPVAAAMARLLQPLPGQLILDPYCGSGTLLIESKQLYPQISHQGWDNQSEAIDIAHQSAEQAGVQIQFQCTNSLTEIVPNSFLLLSNPPWDAKHLILPAQKDQFMNSLLHLINRSEQSVLILPENLLRFLADRSAQSFELVAKTRIRGQLVGVGFFFTYF